MKRTDPTGQTRGATPPIVDPAGTPVVGSVAALERTTLGEVSQWTLTRGHSSTNPILLVITGGFGGSTIATFRRTLGELERHFTVVTWDCRGAGKSLRAGFPRSGMTVRQLTSDAMELVAQLRERFQQRKIFLLGHALGTVVAVRMLQERPEWFRAYVGIEQIVNPAGRDAAAWQAALDAATAAGHRGAARRLRRAGPPPYTGRWRVLRYAALGRAAARQLGADLGLVRFGIPTAAGPELTVLDRLRVALGQVRTFQVIYPRLQKLDMATQSTRLDVPVFLVTGQQAPAVGPDQAQRYHAALEAPQKAMLRLPGDGPCPHLDQPEPFVAWMVATVLPLAQPATRPPGPVAAG